MSIGEPPQPIKKVDEDWKAQVERERQRQRREAASQGRDFKSGRLENPPEQTKLQEAQALGKPTGPEPHTAGTESELAGPEPPLAGPEAQTADFGLFISSLSMQAMMALGELPHPVTREIHEDLEQARYLIDTLGMLKEKTRGNLDPEEERLLENCLYELRMKYVAKEKR